MTDDVATGAAGAAAPLRGALEGMRILDFTSIVLGPLATRMLGDYGADVITIEATSGDLARSSGAVRKGGPGSVFLAMNRNKRSIAMDLKTHRGLEAVRRLIASADVMVHNVQMSKLYLGGDR